VSKLPTTHLLPINHSIHARFYHLRLFAADSTGKIRNDSFDVASFQQIGTEGSLLPVPLEIRYLLIGPGERFDIIIDFSGCQDKSFSLVNDAPAPYTMGGQSLAEDVLLFKVTKPITEDPKVGSTEIWSFVNITGDVHPLHVHLVRFQVLNRQIL
jgi:spore coat protein A